MSSVELENRVIKIIREASKAVFLDEYKKITPYSTTYGLYGKPYQMESSDIERIAEKILDISGQKTPHNQIELPNSYPDGLGFKTVADLNKDLRKKIIASLEK